MKAAERTIQQLLHSSDQYIMPVFQRYYTWGQSNWDQLFRDALELLGTEATTKRHFLGSIVTVPNAHQPGEIPSYLVIDGQQRLTTLSILLCAIRDYALHNDWLELAAEVEENYLIHRFKKGKERYKLFPRLRDRHSYLNAIDKAQEDKTGGQIDLALAYFHKLLADNFKTESHLRQFFLGLVTRFDLVAITLDNENPYKIFRSLNSTGVDLSEADLIRNHVFMSLPIDQQDEFDDKIWKKLESHFQRDEKLHSGDFEAFLRDALMRDGTYIPKDGTFEHFERRYPTALFDPNIATTELLTTARLYDVVRGVKAHSDNDIEKALSTVRDLNVSTAYPLLTRLLEVHQLNKTSKDDLLLSIRSIAGFVLRRLVCDYSSRAYSSWFVTVCKSLTQNPAHAVIQFLHDKGWPSDAEFIPKFIHFNLYQSKYSRAVLAALETLKQVTYEPVLLSGCSIEHVMPQTIDEQENDGSSWINTLGAEWRRVHGEWLHTPGNLTLVGANYNREMSNKPFNIKKPMLIASKVYLNDYFKNPAILTWGEAYIEERGRKLAEMATRIWIGPTPLAQEPKRELSTAVPKADENTDFVSPKA